VEPTAPSASARYGSAIALELQAAGIAMTAAASHLGVDRRTLAGRLDGCTPRRMTELSQLADLPGLEISTIAERAELIKAEVER
jgi:hypothetical protein